MYVRCTAVLCTKGNCTAWDPWPRRLNRLFGGLEREGSTVSFNFISKIIQRIGPTEFSSGAGSTAGLQFRRGGISRQTGSGRKSGKVWARLCYLAVPVGAPYSCTGTYGSCMAAQ
jgi:hypothetical protein